MTRRSPLAEGAATAVSVGLAFLVAVGLLTVLSGSPADALGAFFGGPVASGLAWGNLVNETLLLTLTGLGAAVAFGAGSFNLGGEGQTYVGGLAALAVALLIPTWGPAGSLTALMTGVFGDPSSMLIASKPVAEALWLPGLLPPSNLNVGALLALPLVLVLGLLVNHTAWGYRLRLVGRNRDFARYAGVSTAAYSLVPLAISGALHGLAGGIGVLGTQHALVQGFSFGWGWSGVAVALIARTNPWAVLPAALLLAYLDQASRSVVLQGVFPFQLSAVLQAAILFFITARLVLPRLRRRP